MRGESFVVFDLVIFVVYIPDKINKFEHKYSLYFIFKSNECVIVNFIDPAR